MATEHQNTGVGSARPTRSRPRRLRRRGVVVGLLTALAAVTGLVIACGVPDTGKTAAGPPVEEYYVEVPDSPSSEDTAPATTAEPPVAPDSEPAQEQVQEQVLEPVLEPWHEPESEPEPEPEPRPAATTTGETTTDTPPQPPAPPPATSQSQTTKPTPKPTPPPTVKPAPVTYSAIAGPGCGGSTGFVRYGEYRNGLKGWIDHGSGCGSAFVSVPMSGNARTEDPNAYTRWNFTTGKVKTGSCALSVHVPKGDLAAVGGDPTHYRVFERFGGTVIGTFQVRQVVQRGQWVRVGTYRITAGSLSIQMLNTGVNWNSRGATWAHHAAATIKADCTT